MSTTHKLRYLNYECDVIVKDPNEHIQKHWANGTFYETQRNGLLAYIANTEPKGMKIIDIGASIGNHSLFFATVMEAKELHSIEPSVDSANHCVENFRLNISEIGGISITSHNIALGSKEGLCMMKSVSDSNVGMKQVDEVTFAMRFTKGVVDIKPIDSMIEFADYDLIKIDVEHYNEPLLIGAKETFTKGTGNIYIEAETEEVLAVTDKYMTEYGYTRVPNLVLNHTPTYKYYKSGSPIWI